MTDKLDPEYEIPKVIPQVEEAFEEIFRMDSEWSLEQRFDRLLEAMTASAFYLMDRQRRTGKKVGEAERDFQEEGMAQLRLIDKCWTIAKKHGRVSTAPNPTFEGDMMARIVKMKGTMSDIVQTVPVNKKEG
jgi:hypothetical protein